MRAVLWSDRRAVLRVACAAPPENRRQICQRIFWAADLADRYTRRLGRPHPIWGNGTVLAAAARFPVIATSGVGDHSGINPKSRP